MAARVDSGPDTVLEVDVKTCLHAGHQHTACTSNTPRARLIFHNGGRWRLVLGWEPHSGAVAFFSRHTGKFNAVEMRNQFRQYRRSAVQYIVPEIAHNVLPEMNCFRIGECDCLNYGNDAQVGKLLLGRQQPYETAQHTHIRVDICQHPNKDAYESPCIVTSYKRIIEGFCPGQGAKAIPSHDWFHAMDRSSYNSPTTRRVKESCKDPSCKNSYALSILGCYNRDL
ncbi:unnamed protein product [Clonostachys chloroleuca]|uniref:Uncharacterized protein n=1 Tax=Clonostachys chloroleuca TaxID=1926264 RepID=A0AA35Q3N7_9HYPO|nr:unnamed protein product [Clonostachys chloroleuca]